MEVLISLLMIPIGIALGAATIGLGIKWGGTWLLRAISNDPVLERWVKQVFNPSEN